MIYITCKGDDKYGRTLGILYLNSELTNNLNEMLVEKYLADEYYGKTKKKEFDKHYLSLQHSKKIIEYYNNNQFNDIKSFLINFLHMSVKYRNSIRNSNK